MWYNENTAIDSIGVDFLPEESGVDNADITGFIENVKARNRLPFDKIDVFYNDDYWNFEGYTKTNVPSSSFHFDFRKVEPCFRDDLKAFVLICIIENRKKINILNLQFRLITKFFHYCTRHGIPTVTDIKEDDAPNWILEDTQVSARYMHQKGQAVRSFFEYFNANFKDIFTKGYFDAIFAAVDAEQLNAEIKNNKTENIPDKLFDQFISAAIRTIDDEKAPSYYRALSCMFLMDSQIGLRTGELYALTTDCMKKITISTGDTAYFIEYTTWKRLRGTGTVSKEITYVNQLFKKGFNAILEISANKRKKLKTDLLFVESKGGKSTAFPVSPTRATDLMVDLFKYYDRFFPTVFESPQQITGLSCTSLTRPRSTKSYVIHPTYTQLRVHVCSELYAKGCPLDYIERFMSHLSSEMAGYYIRPKNSVQENMEESVRVLKDIVTKEAVPIGPDKGLMDKIDAFIKENNFRVETDLDEICQKLAANIPIRIKSGGVCIKSSRFRECSKDAKTDEFYCAYGVCPNIFTFYYMADISYRQVKELSEAIDLNKKRGCIKQAQKSTLMRRTILNQKLIPQITELKRTISDKGLDFVLTRHPHMETIVLRLDTIEKEIASWTQNNE